MLLCGERAAEILDILHEMPKEVAEGETDGEEVQKFLAFVDVALASQNNLVCDPMLAKQAFLGTNASDIAWCITNLMHYSKSDTPLSPEEAEAAASSTTRSGNKSQRRNKRVQVACKAEDKRKIEHCWKSLRLKILRWEEADGKEERAMSSTQRAELIKTRLRVKEAWTVKLEKLRNIMAYGNRENVEPSTAKVPGADEEEDDYDYDYTSILPGVAV